MFDLAGLNWWAVLVAVVAAFALAGLWYGPLFGKAWLAALGKSEEDFQPSPKPFIVSAAAALIAAIAIAALLQGLQLTGLASGLTLGAATGVAFVATAIASDAAHSGWGWKLWAILSGYRVGAQALMGGIIGIWP